MNKDDKNYSQVISQLREWLGDEEYANFVRDVIIELKDKLIREIGVN